MMIKNKKTSSQPIKHYEKYVRTDLASETVSFQAITEKEEIKKPAQNKGYIYKEQEFGYARISTLEISEKSGVEMFQKPIGRYITISFKKIWLLSETERSSITSLVAAELNSLCKNVVPEYKSVLVVGLGNRSITADSIGPQSLDELIVTRHLGKKEISLINQNNDGNYPIISAIAPGVVGQTGIETAEYIASTAKLIKPQIVVCIDALAARSIDRLATTIQLSDAGIAPGSGVKNDRMSINRKLLGIPVIAIGVPTIVDSSTLVYDALEKAGIIELSTELLSVLDNGRSFFVSLKETDIAAKEFSSLISNVLNLAFTL